jgi:hypothetical protein
MQRSSNAKRTTAGCRTWGGRPEPEGSGKGSQVSRHHSSATSVLARRPFRPGLMRVALGSKDPVLHEMREGFHTRLGHTRARDLVRTERDVVCFVASDASERC